MPRAFALALLAVGCGSSEPAVFGEEPADAGSGGSAVGSGGAPGTGGKGQAGGTVGTGGASAGSGGAKTGTGGAVGTGGASAGSGGAPGNEIAVYTDAVSLTSLAWKGNGTFKESTTGCYEGSKCYQYDYSVKTYWDGFFLNMSKAVDASGATALNYAYKGLATASSGTFFFIRLHSGSKACAAGCDIENNVAAADWQIVSIPISRLQNGNEIDLNNITAIEIGFSGPDATGSISFDDIVFAR